MLGVGSSAVDVVLHAAATCSNMFNMQFRNSCTIEIVSLLRSDDIATAFGFQTRVDHRIYDLTINFKACLMPALKIYMSPMLLAVL